MLKRRLRKLGFQRCSLAVGKGQRGRFTASTGLGCSRQRAASARAVLEQLVPDTGAEPNQCVTLKKSDSELKR